MGAPQGQESAAERDIFTKGAKEVVVQLEASRKRFLQNSQEEERPVLRQKEVEWRAKNMTERASSTQRFLQLKTSARSYKEKSKKECLLSCQEQEDVQSTLHHANPK